MSKLKRMASPPNLCSHCAVHPDRPVDEPIPALAGGQGRLAWQGYSILVSEAGFRPRVRLDTPAAVIYDGPEPGRRWTEKGATIALAGPPVLLALAVAVLLNLLELPPLLPVAALLIVAGLAWLAVAIRWRIEGRLRDRAIDAGWLMLSPRLHEPAFARSDLLFLAGLAQVSVGQGQPLLRGPALRRILLLAEQAGAAPPRPLAALARLAIADCAATGGDPAPLACQLTVPVFRGTLPLACADHLFAALTPAFFSPPERARLRASLCAAAFEAGLGIHDLVEIGMHAPALRALLALDDIGGVARLRLIWEMRASRPWADCGDAFTIFELADHPRLIGKQLDVAPDLLLWHAGPDTELGEAPTSIGIAAQGVLYAGQLFTQPPDPIAVHRPPRGYELQAGAIRIHYRHDPTAAAEQLRVWCDWCFHDFQPQALTLLTRRTPPVRLCGRCQRLTP